MTRELVPYPSKAPAAVQPTAQAAAKTLAQIQARYLAIFDEYPALKRAAGPGFEYQARKGRDEPLSVSWISREADRQHALSDARHRLASLPDVGAMTALSDRLAAAMEEPFDRDRSRFIVGLMVDSFRAKPHAPEIFFEALMHELEAANHAPAVVARACSELRRTAIHPPAIAEVLAKCEEAAGLLAGPAWTLKWAIAARSNTEEALAAMEALGELTPEREEEIRRAQWSVTSKPAE